MATSKRVAAFPLSKKMTWRLSYYWSCLYPHSQIFPRSNKLRSVQCRQVMRIEFEEVDRMDRIADIDALVGAHLLEQQQALIQIAGADISPCSCGQVGTGLSLLLEPGKQAFGFRVATRQRVAI